MMYTDDYVRRLQTDIEQLKLALRFYADEKNYIHDTGYDMMQSIVCMDAGNTARKGLNTFFGNETK